MKRILIALLLLLPLMVQAAPKKPNFAYPKTVSANAETALKTALKKHDNRGVVRAVMDWSTAQNLITNDNLPRVLARIDSVASLVDDEAVQSLLSLMQAEMAGNYLDANPVRPGDDDRKTVEVPPLTDFDTWSRQDFDCYIADKIEAAMRPAKSLQFYYLADWPDVISAKNDLTHKYYPTLYDFVGVRSVAILGGNYGHGGARPIIDDEDDDVDGAFDVLSLPEMTLEKARKAGLKMAIYKRLIDFHAHDPEIVVNYCVEAGGGHLSFNKSFKQAYERYADSPACVQLLDAVDMPAAKDEYYHLCKAAVEKYPSFWATTKLRNIVAKLQGASLKATMPTQVLPGREFKLEIRNNNAKRYTMRAYRVKRPDFLRNASDRFGDYAGKQEVYSHTVTCDSAYLFSVVDTLSVKLDDPGFYILTLNEDTDQPSANQYASLLQCSEITGVNVRLSGNQDDNTGYASLVVDALSGSPLGDAQVTFTHTSNKAEGNVQNLGKTDKGGLTPLANPKMWEQGFYTYTKGDKEMILNANRSAVGPINNRLAARVYTSLSLLRPGDTVDYMVLAVKGLGSPEETLADAYVKVDFYDANYTLLDTQEVRTDQFGRASGTLSIPKNTLTGYFSINARVSDKDPNGKDKESANFVTTSKSIMVSDYKMPSFSVDMAGVTIDEHTGAATVRGKVLNNVGFPMASTTVQLTLRKVVFYGFWASDDQYVGQYECCTNDSGEFEYVFEPDVLTKGAFYSVSAEATIPTGETHADMAYFSYGKPYRLYGLFDNRNIDASKAVKMPVGMYDLDGKEQKTTLTWTLTDNGNQVVASGKCSKGDAMDWKAVKPGMYTFTIVPEDTALADKYIMTVNIYNPESDILFSDKLIWLPESQYTADSRGKVEFVYSTSAEQTVLHVFTNTLGKPMGHEWFTVGRGYHTLTLKDIADYTSVELLTVNDGKVCEAGVSVSAPPVQPLVIATESFRDQLTPGSGERWKFTIRANDSDKSTKAVIGQMYNTALDLIYPYTFGFSPRDMFSYTPSVTAHIPVAWRLAWDQTVKTVKTVELAEPTFDVWQDFGLMQRHKQVLYRSMATGASPTADIDFDEDFAVEAVPVAGYTNGRMKGLALNEVAADSAESETDGGIEIPEDNRSEYRDSEVALAFFMPDLTTDKDGNLEIAFNVPDANATWKLNMGVWNTNVLCGSLQREFTASKPLMVKPNPPRFLRTADRSQIPTMVMNATDAAVTAKVVAEVFDPMSGRVLASEEASLKIAPNASEVYSFTLTAPEGCAAVGFRVKANAGRAADGEQVVIPVLAAAQPVIESQTFYLAPDQTATQIDLKRVPADAVVTLQYCDNPAWYVATALPGLRADMGRDANGAAAALFSCAVARKIMADNPQIETAIRRWADNPADSTLVSMLQRNADLKIALLEASPWVKNAADDTERMARLVLLFDRKVVDESMAEAIAALASYEASEGGWRWCSYMKEASEWTTSNILSMLGQLNELGCMPADKTLEAMTTRAVKWYDEYTADIYKRNPRGGDFTLYQAVRDMFPEVKQSSAASRVTNYVLQYIIDNWRMHSIGVKAIDASILAHHGYDATSRLILESLEEYSTFEPLRGRWFPSLYDSHSYGLYNGPVASTALVLRSWQSLEPRSMFPQQFRQWLILQKEAQDWGTAVSTTETVATILLGDKPLKNAAPVDIKVDGKSLDLNAMDAVTGYVKTALDPSTRVIDIARSGNSPAWGSVVYAYAANPDEIRAAACDDLSVEKLLLVERNGKWQEATTFAVGDRVRVRLILRSSRDLQYVTVVDNRAAAFEPTDPLPGTCYSEGILFYRENRDTATNIFVTHMPKGTYVVEYDVYANNAGVYASGTAEAQSQYAPAISAHSAGRRVIVK